MLRHDNVSDQTDADTLLQDTESIDHDALHGIVPAESEAPVARYRPEIRVPRFVITAKSRRHAPNLSNQDPRFKCTHADDA